MLAIDYFANHSQQKTIRNIEAVGIFLMSNNWYLIAYCWLRKDYRTFKIERIPKIVQTNTDFKKLHSPLKTYLNEVTKENKELHKVVIRLDLDVIRYIGDQKFYNGFVSEREVKDKMEMTFLTASLEGFARWFLMYGDHAEIISPSSLKDRIVEIIKNLKNKNNF